MPRNATVLLIRHAEKTGHPDDPLLSTEGLCRAYAYAGYFRTRPGLSAPGVLIAAKDQPDSKRPRMTLEPLAAMLGIKVEATLDEEAGIATLAKRLQTDRALDGLTTLICWRHTELLHLAQALGVKRKWLPKKWPDDEFGWMVQIDYDADGEIIHAHIGSQRLMFGDTRVPKVEGGVSAQYKSTGSTSSDQRTLRASGNA